MAGRVAAAGLLPRWWATRARWAVALVVALSVSATACGSDEGTATTIAEVAEPSGKSYQLARAAGIEVPTGATVNLAFDASVMRETGGCNVGSGFYKVANSKLVVDTMSMTQKACLDESSMTFDQQLVDFLTSSPGIVIVGDVMTLQSAEITLTMREAVPVNDSPLEGTAWTVTGTVEGDDTQSLQTSPATIRLDGGTAQVFAGCNTGTASYTVDGTKITWGPLGLTKKACTGDAAALEATVVAVLQGTTGFDIEATKLVLLQGAGGLTLTAG